MSIDPSNINTDLATLVGYGLDKGWVITCAGFVFFMQIGLGLMEIGSIRRKNSRVVWFKILLNLISVIFWWWIIGFAWGFGSVNGSFIGAERFYAGNKWGQPLNQGINSVNYNIAGPGYTTQYAHFLWRMAIASVSTTIATAIVSERITMKAVLLFNFAFNMIIQPFIFAWTYGLGFLVDDIGYFDYAGSFIIFGVGATAGLIGLLFIRPRYNRYERFPVVLPPLGVEPVGESRPFIGGVDPRAGNLPSVAFDRMRPNNVAAYSGPTYAQPVDTTAFTIPNIIRARKMQDEDEYETFATSNYGLVILGAIILFIGFIFFNAGASQGLQQFYLFDFAEHAAANSIIAAMGGGLFAMLFLAFFVRRRPVRENAATIARAFIAGVVCVTTASNVYRPWAAFVSGLCGAFAYLVMAYIMYRSQLDDPSEFFSIFWPAGFAGLIVAAFFNIVNGILYSNETEGEILIWQVLSWGILLGWTAIISFLTFGLAYLLRILRVGIKCEIVGYDYIDGARHLDYPDRDVLTMEKERRKAGKNAGANANAEAL